jgi:hypothetical protein
MKTIIKYIFDGEDINDDKYNMENIINGNEYRLALEDIQDILRSYRKYEDLSSYTVETLFNKIDEEIMEVISERMV